MVVGVAIGVALGIASAMFIKPDSHRRIDGFVRTRWDDSNLTDKEIMAPPARPM
jgi:gas vesicle protein